MKMETRVKKLRELEAGRLAILKEMDSEEAREDSFHMEMLRGLLEQNRDEVGYYRECN